MSPARAFSSLGLRMRLLVVVALVLAGMTAMISTYFPARARASSFEALVREASTVGRVAAHSIAPALLFDDHTDAVSVLAGIRETAGVAYLVVVAADGTTFAAAGIAEPYSQPGIHRLSTPIVHAGKTLGRVDVGVALSGLEAEAKQIRSSIWAFSAALFLLATGVTVGLGTMVIRPLAGMIATAQRISRGEHDERVPVRSSDETGRLAKAINRMLDDLQAARRELELLNQDLEKRVDVRTEELAGEIVERKRGQEALQRSNERFELAASAVDGAIYDWSMEGNVLSWSDGLTRVFGYRPSENLDLAKWWSSHVHPEDLERVRRQHEAALADASDFLCEYRLAHHDGRYLSVLDRGRLLCDPSGQPVRMVGVVENITELRQLEEQFLHSQRMEAVGRLAGGVAHDFNNLLTTILGYSEILQATMDPTDPRLEDVAEIRKSGERAAGLTQQLLAFSRKQRTTPRLLDVGSVLTDLERMLRRLIGEDILLETAIPQERLLVMADRSQLDQVLINIAVNARDAMPRGGKLAISAVSVELDDSFVRVHLGSRPGPHVRIEIRDNGMGMPQEVLARVFEPFYTTKEVGKGTGLGMSIVYGIIAQWGGYVSVESAPERGTIVRLYLPVTVGEPEPAAPAAPSAIRGTERVLVVEDEASLRALLRTHLSKNGYEVIEARDGQQALQVAGAVAGSIDLVLTDLVMPNMGGREMADSLRRKQPDLRVLFMSGYSEDRTRDYAELAAGEQFLSKPFALQDLLHKVRQILDGNAGPQG